MLFGAVALLCAQVWLAAHEVEHLVHPGDDRVCEICLTGQGHASPLPPAPLILAISSPAAADVAVLPPMAAGWTLWRPHLARAPPRES